MATNAQVKAKEEADKATDIDDLKEQFDILKTEMKAMTDLLGSTAKDRAGSVREIASDARDDAIARMELMGSEARARVDSLQGDAERAVASNPLTALAISAGIGFVIGALTRR